MCCVLLMGCFMPVSGQIGPVGTWTPVTACRVNMNSNCIGAMRLCDDDTQKKYACQDADMWYRFSSNLGQTVQLTADAPNNTCPYFFKASLYLVDSSFCCSSSKQGWNTSTPLWVDSFVDSTVIFIPDSGIYLIQLEDHGLDCTDPQAFVDYSFAFTPGISCDASSLGFLTINSCDSVPEDTISCPPNTSCVTALILCNDTMQVEPIPSLGDPACGTLDLWYLIYAWTTIELDIFATLPNTGCNNFFTAEIYSITYPLTECCDGLILDTTITFTDSATLNFPNSYEWYFLKISDFGTNCNDAQPFVNYFLDMAYDYCNPKLAPALIPLEPCDTCATNTQCDNALALCQDTVQTIACDCMDSLGMLPPLFYEFSVVDANQAVNLFVNTPATACATASSGFDVVSIYGPLPSGVSCANISSNYLEQELFNVQNVNYDFLGTGDYIIKLLPKGCISKCPPDSIDVVIDFTPDLACDSLPPDTCATNTVCDSTLWLCKDTLLELCYRSQEYWYSFEVTTAPKTVDLSMLSGQQFGYAMYGPVIEPACNVSQWTTVNAASTTLASITLTDPGTYYLMVVPITDNQTLSIDFTPDNYCGGAGDMELCESCIGSFAPIPGKRYVISGWAREEGAPLTKTSFDEPHILIRFPGFASAGPFYPAGGIIEGWQRIEAEFRIPAGAVSMGIDLRTLSGPVLFDDIRVFPFNASMKSYVYDPVNMRLMAELDERNYATYYEYNEEGQLMRIKKETEKGVMTIQETKQNTKQKP